MIPAPAKTLVDAVYGPRWGDAYLEWGIFDAAGFHRIGSGRASTATPPLDCAVFWSAGLLKPGADRANGNVEKLMVFLIDDVGTAPNSRFDPGELELFMPEPTSIIESSPGNHQWQWGLSDGMDEDVVTALRRSLPWQSHATAMSNLIRLPMGVNGKPGIAHQVREVKRGPTYVAVEFVQRCGGLRVPVQPKKQVVAELKAPSEGAVIEILKLLPNDGVSLYCDSEPAWFNFCQALHGATGGEGLGLWQAWCAAQPQERDVVGVWNRQDPVSSGWDTLVMYADKWGKGSRGALAGIVFDDGALPPEPEPSSFAKVKGDFGPVLGKAEQALARRLWLYGGRLIRGYLSGSVAAGGTGKSSLTMVEAVAMASQRDLLGVGLERMPRSPLRVLIWNGEDPQVELELRYHAILKEHGVSHTEVGGRLFVISGRDFPIGIGGEDEKRDMEWLWDKVREKKIDVVMIDPFVSSHRVPENDNMAIDRVAKFWTALAEKCGCAVDLVHHVRKPGNGMAVDLTVDDARGASALVNASRNARVLSTMSVETAKDVGLDPAFRGAYVVVQHDATKANMMPRVTGADYYQFKTVQLNNGDPYPADGGLPIDGDKVGVLVRWFPSNIKVSDDPTKVLEVQNTLSNGGNSRRSDQCVDWFGTLVADALGLNVKTDKKRLNKIIENWIAQGWFKEAVMKDEKYNKRTNVVVGNRPEIINEDDDFS